MKALMNIYILNFFHPFRMNEYYKNLRMQRTQTLPRLGEEDFFEGKAKGESSVQPEIFEKEEVFTPLKLNDALLLSWVFYIINSLFSLGLFIGALWLLQEMGQEEWDTVMDYLPFSLQNAFKFIINLTGWNIIFFPLSTWVVANVWKMFIKFFAKIFYPEKFGHLERTEQSIEEVLMVSLSSYLFYIIPIFGPMLQNVFYLFFLLAGLRKNLELTWGQSLFVIFSPLFILFLFFFFILTSLLLPLL